MSDTTFIYGLREPDTGELRYVGKANDLNRRYRDHLKDERPSHKKSWLDSLKNRGLLPSIEIIFEVPESEWQQWEILTISLFRKMGCVLVNSTDGGEGMHNPSSEVREARRKRMRGNKFAVGNKNCLGRHASPETKERLRLSHLGKGQSEETRMKISETLTGVSKSPETKERMSHARRGEKNHFFGKALSEEHKRKVSEGMRRYRAKLRGGVA